MSNWIKLPLIAALALSLAWLIVQIFDVLPRLTTRQALALETLRAPPPAHGTRNGFAAIWASGHGVPEQDVEEVLMQEIAAWEAYIQDGDVPPRSVLHNYPALAGADGEDAPCTWSTDDCLAVVRQDMQSAEQWLLQTAEFARRSMAIAQYDHVHNRMPAHLATPLLGYRGHGEVALTRAAHLHASGDFAAAIESICAFGRTWRPFVASTDMLLTQISVGQMIASAARLRAAILAEISDPPDGSPECDEAFSPLSDSEIDLCSSMRGEWRTFEPMVLSMRGDASSLGERATTLLMYHQEHTLAMLAEQIYKACALTRSELAARRQPFDADQVEDPSCPWHAYAFNPIGCVLATIGAPPAENYYNRLLDTDARLRLVQLAIALRSSEGRSPAQVQSEAERLLPYHHVDYDPERGVLSVAQPHTSSGKPWSVVLQGATLQ
ncbi:MAG TPA: hypothetical protein PKZ76_02485 [Xanthomonadaceae bacterium]|nr:hypothetical protein [Xanthomonadaceae bacterium]